MQSINSHLPTAEIWFRFEGITTESSCHGDLSRGAGRDHGADGESETRGEAGEHD